MNQVQDIRGIVILLTDVVSICMQFGKEAKSCEFPPKIGSIWGCIGSCMFLEIRGILKTGV